MTEIITIAGLVALCFIGFIIIKTVLANQQRRKAKSQARQTAWEKARAEASAREQEAVTQRATPCPAKSHGKQYLQHPPDLRYPEEIDPNCKILYSEHAVVEPPTQRKLSDVVSGKVPPRVKTPTRQTRAYTKPTRPANPSPRGRSQDNSFNFPDYPIIPTSVAVFDDAPSHSSSSSYEGHGGSSGGGGATADWSAPDTSSSSFDSGGGGFDSGSSGGFGSD